MMRNSAMSVGEVIVQDDQQAVRQATLRFYEALDDLLCNGETAAMAEIWAHADNVSTVHPFGHWAIGWDEVWACWKESAAVFSYYRGHANRTDGIGTIHDLKVTVIGDMAYTFGTYKSLMYFPDHPRPLSVNCTDVLARCNGQWKMIHHHADQASEDYQKALARLVES